MLKATVIFLVVVLGISLAVPCYCQEREIKTLDGTIYGLDWAGSSIVIKWLNISDNSYRELILNVPDDAVIRKGADTIESSELQIEDPVTVKYYENTDGTCTLISLEDTSMSPSP